MHLTSTPLYEYELLTQAFRCNVALKLENLQVQRPLLACSLTYSQKFGDVYPRNYVAMLAGQYLHQKETIQKEFSEIGGFIIILDPQENYSVVSMLPLVLVSRAMKGVTLRPYIFVMEGTLFDQQKKKKSARSLL